MENQKSLIIVIVLAIVVVLGGAGLYASQSMQINSLRQEMVAAVGQQGLAIGQLSSQIGDLKQAGSAGTVTDSSSATATIEPQAASGSGTAASSDGQTFTSAKGGYSFQYPSAWKAFINQYNSQNTLFGPDASASSGLGGIEVTEFAGDLNDWLKYLEANTEISFVSNSFTKIAGMSAVKATTKAHNQYSTSVYIKNGGKIFALYINSAVAGDLEKFNQIVDSFEFAK